MLDAFRFSLAISGHNDGLSSVIGKGMPTLARSRTEGKIIAKVNIGEGRRRDGCVWPFVYASANPVCSQRSAHRVSYSALLGRRCLIRRRMLSRHAAQT